MNPEIILCPVKSDASDKCRSGQTPRKSSGLQVLTNNVITVSALENHRVALQIPAHVLPDESASHPMSAPKRFPFSPTSHRAGMFVPSEWSPWLTMDHPDGLTRFPRSANRSPSLCSRSRSQPKSLKILRTTVPSACRSTVRVECAFSNVLDLPWLCRFRFRKCGFVAVCQRPAWNSNRALFESNRCLSGRWPN